MTNFYSVFYWLTVADNVKKFFDITSNIFTGAAIIACVGLFVCSIAKAAQSSNNKVKNDEEEKVDADVRAWELARKYFLKTFYPMLVLSLLMWSGYVFTPTKKDCLMIVAGGAVGNFITTDSSAKSIPSDITKFLHLSLNKEIDDLSYDTKQDIKKELGIQSPKERLIDKAKQMTKDELIKYLQSDSTVNIK